MDITVSKHTHTRKKCPISKESNTFAKHLDLTTKVIDIRNKAIEVEKHEERRKNLINQRRLAKKNIHGRYAQRIRNADIDIVK